MINKNEMDLSVDASQADVSNAIGNAPVGGFPLMGVMPSVQIPYMPTPMNVAPQMAYPVYQQANCMTRDANGISVIAPCGGELDLGVSGEIDF